MNTKNKKCIFFILLLFTFAFTIPAFAADVSLEWDAPLIGTAASYKVYWSYISDHFKGHIYENSINIGLVTSYTLTIVGDIAWIVVVAITTDTTESDYSNVVYYNNGKIGKSQGRML